ncbi:MAG: aldehyde dehydrogenase family protein, partial [Actinobacteria bacterium]|nr:aldehyde dehydrogenase family protein [Actinomycetota bacterium]
MNSDQLIATLATNARRAARTLATATYEERQQALLAIATLIEKKEDEILRANSNDVQRERAAGMNESLLDRLTLNPARIAGMANGARKVAQLSDPLHQTLRHRVLDNGLELTQVSVPFGVVGMIYEARPNVTLDAAVILLMSGNAALLRGSSSASQTNQVLVEIMKEALTTTPISPEVLQLVPSDDRDTVRALLHARGLVDLVIPRGSASLIRTVVDESLVPA